MLSWDTIHLRVHFADAFNRKKQDYDGWFICIYIERKIYIYIHIYIYIFVYVCIMYVERVKENGKGALSVGRGLRSHYIIECCVE